MLRPLPFVLLVVGMLSVAGCAGEAAGERSPIATAGGDAVTASPSAAAAAGTDAAGETRVVPDHVARLGSPVTLADGTVVVVTSVELDSAVASTDGAQAHAVDTSAPVTVQARVEASTGDGSVPLAERITVEFVGASATIYAASTDDCDLAESLTAATATARDGRVVDAVCATVYPGDVSGGLWRLSVAGTHGPYAFVSAK